MICIIMAGMKRNPFAIATLAAVTLLHGVVLYAGNQAALQPPQPLPMVAMQMATIPASSDAAAPTSAPAATPVRMSPSPARPASKAATRPVRQPLVPAPVRQSQGEAVSDKTATRVSTTAAAEGNSDTAATANDGQASLTLPQYRGDYLHNPKPAYPPLSLELGEQGTAEFRVEVSAAGEAVSVALAKSSGYPRLDRAAREAVQRWRFLPARRGTEAVAHSFVVPVNFSLKSAQS